MPQEFKISDDSRERAEQLSNRFAEYALHPDSSVFEADGDRTLRAFASETADGVPMDDVLDDTQEFARIAYIAQRTNRKIAGIKISEIGVVPVIGFFEDPLADVPFWIREELLWREHALRAIRRDDIQRISLEKAIAAFSKGLGAFLSHRIEGFRFWRQLGDDETPKRTGTSSRASGGKGPAGPAAGGTRPPPPGSAASGGAGFYIQLTCTNHHLSAYASPAYALTWRNLGSLTSPANGILPPGTWIFGAKGGMFRHITHDPNAVYIPPTFTPCTNHF